MGAGVDVMAAARVGGATTLETEGGLSQTLFIDNKDEHSNEATTLIPQRRKAG